MSFGQVIANRRKALGLKQSELAGKVGVSQPIVARWEKNQTRPRMNKLGHLAQALEISEDELLHEANQLDVKTLKEKPVLNELVQQLAQLESYQLEAISVVVRDMATRSRMDRLLRT